MNFPLARNMRKNVWLLSLSALFTLFIPSAAFAACSSPAGVGGDVIFNSAGHVIQSCDGTSWKGWLRSIPGTWKDVKPGIFHICGIKADNTAFCWGRNGSGEIGNGTSGSNVLYPASVSGAGAWADVSTGGNNGSGIFSTCGIKMNGSLYCWGDNNFGQGGNSSTSAANAPRAVTFSGTWQEVSVGDDFACALKSDNSVWCWGQNNHNQWGDGVNFGSWFWDAHAVASAGAKWKKVEASSNWGNGFACGLKNDDTAWCWGYNNRGQLGFSSSGTDSKGPVAVITTGVQTWKSISAGGNQSCGIKTDGTGWCWGGNDYGEIGVGVTGGTYTTPQAISVSGVTTWTDIVAGDSQTCGIKTDGTGWCWGYGQEGNNGDGAISDYNTPHEIQAGSKWKVLRPGWVVCGIKLDGSLWCWGENYNGAVGNGTTSQQNAPTHVTGSSGTSCSSPSGTGGDLLFNSAYRVLQWCDGTQWNPAGPISPTGPLAGCVSPAGVAGDLLFNSTAARHQYCDGDTWRGITP
ncbi:MAG: repeat domain protein [Micavibrio sp.]|nr:repeat domain protein [Micavibrio sp.]